MPSFKTDKSKRPLFAASPKSLKILAALIWYAGGVVLLLKGRELLIEAEGLRPEIAWTWLAIPGGLFLGGLKARFIFVKSCQKNLARIATLERPRIWQFYHPRFFLALAIMITAGATLSRLAHGSYPFLIGVATLDLSLATALLGSSIIYWGREAPRVTRDTAQIRAIPETAESQVQQEPDEK